MIPSLYKDKITVQRRSLASTNAFGEPTYTYNTIYTSIPARIENDRAIMQYNKSGQRVVNYTIIYVPPQYTILEQDLITNVTSGSINLGLVSGINAAVQAGPGLDHNEVIIENP